MINFSHPYAQAVLDGKSVQTRLTIAYKIDPGAISFQIAVCSPQDQFSRAGGRKKASARLQNIPVTIPYTGSDDYTAVRSAIFEYVTQNSNTIRFIPNRMKSFEVLPPPVRTRPRADTCVEA